jgi:hypothetical protein
VCSIAAAAKYELPTNLVLAVAEQEGGQPGQWVRNANGTHDVGVMQFNTAYLESELARYGIQAEDVAAQGCYPYELASWRLRTHLRNDEGDIWTRAANYHSRTPYRNGVYRAKLMQKAAKWAGWLQSNFPPVDGTRGSTTPPRQTQFSLSQGVPTTALVSTPRRKAAAPITTIDIRYTPRAIRAASDRDPLP